MGAWMKCPECGGRVDRLKVMEISEESYSPEEKVARSLIGILDTKKWALKCQDCGKVSVVDANLRRR